MELLNELRVAATGILVLISDVVFGGAVTPIVGIVAGVSIATLWFVVPLTVGATGSRMARAQRAT